jgi:hypothetical protein
LVTAATYGNGFTPPQRLALAVFLLTWIAALVYAWLMLDRGWVPHDEGALAQSAERVLGGELPHKDFNDIYTGGLSLLNALAFKLFGLRLLSLRIMLFAAFAIWVPLVYWIARRFVSPVGAAAATLISVVWSVPNYSAAVPSWYNLFLATAGIACLLCYLDTRQTGWLMVAGAAGGVSCLFKIVGLYFVAAEILFLIFVEQTFPGTSTVGDTRTDRRYTWLVGLSLVVFMGGLFGLLRRNLGFGEFLNFLVPGIAVAGVVAAAEVGSSRRMFVERLRFTVSLFGPLLAGVAIPLIGFALLYLAKSSLGELWTGVAVSPFRRLSYAARPPELTVGMLPSAAIVGVVILGAGSRSTKAVIGTLTLGIVLLGILLGSEDYRVYQLGWQSMNQAIPVLVLWGALVAARPRLDPLRRQELMLLIASLGLCSLVRFPFAAPIYSMYVLPLAVLTFLSVTASYPALPFSLAATLAGFYLAFPILRVTPGFLDYIGYSYAPDAQRTPLKLPRTGLRVDAESSEEYRSLAVEIRSHATRGYIYATPDCPEVYFLSGLRNPTKTLFEFLDQPGLRTARVMAEIRKADVEVVVENQRPHFSGQVPNEMRDSLAVAFPKSRAVGRFIVRWRE